MDSHTPLTAAEIELLCALVCNDFGAPQEILDAHRLAEFTAAMPRLLSMLAQAQTEAAVLSRVIDVMGYSGDYQRIPERLASMFTPPTDATLREAVERCQEFSNAECPDDFSMHQWTLNMEALDTLLDYIRAVQAPRLTEGGK